MRVTCELAWVDVETTGLDPDQHEIVQVAIIRTSPELEVRWVLEVFVQPEHLERAAPEALELNGYNAELWAQRNAAPIGRVLQVLVPALTEATPAGHVVGFDLSFLRAAARREGVELPRMDHHTVDTAAMCWPLMHYGMAESLKLAECCRVLGVSNPAPHSALADAWASLELARCMVRRFAGGTLRAGC